MKKIRITVIGLLTVLMTFALAGCSKAPYSMTGECMNTSYEIIIYDEEMDTETAEQILEDTAAEITRLDGILNHMTEGSDVYKINHAAGKRVDTAQELRDIISIGILIGNMTDGAFDMTMGPLYELWDFDSDAPVIPSDSDIESALEHVFYGDMATQGSQLWLADPEAELDFTYMADSFIAYYAANLMTDKGVSQAEIRIGNSTLMVGYESISEEDGAESEKTPWTVTVDNKKNGEVQTIGTIQLADAAVAVTSAYEKSFEQDGKTYHHILDPETGYPAETDLQAAAVITDNAYSRYCSILSATCILLGNTEAQSFIADLSDRNPDMGIEAVFLHEDGTVYKTDGIELATE